MKCNAYVIIKLNGRMRIQEARGRSKRWFMHLVMEEVGVGTRRYILFYSFIFYKELK